MSLQIFCPNCALEIAIEEDLMGDKGQCPRCGHKFIIGLEHRHPPSHDDLGTAPTIKIIKDEGFDFDLGDGEEPWVGSTSFGYAVVAGILLLLATVASIAFGQMDGRPAWMAFPAGLHVPFGYGSVALLAAAFAMEALGRRDRFEHLHESLPFVLLVAVIGLFGANVAGACAVTGRGAHTVMALVSGLVAGAALCLVGHLEKRPEADRSMVLVLVAMAIGAVMMAAHLGQSALANPGD